MSASPTALLTPLTPVRSTRPKLSCVALAHNEIRLIGEFLNHYRALGVDRFLIVDDRSTDGTGEFLAAQPDIDLFTPVEGSSYARDKRQWRAQLLDQYCDKNWAVVPDIDEHLVYDGMEDIDLPALTARLDAEGADALHATMVDMYRDAPLEVHRVEEGSLLKNFPLFDGPESYFRFASPRKFRAKYPTPFYFVAGGMRQRLFQPLPITPGSREDAILQRQCSLARPYSDTITDRLRLVYARFRLKSVLSGQALYNNSKIPLVKWRRGLWYYNGAHALSQHMVLSYRQAALLHFKFAGGVESLSYNAERGQHTDGGSYYRNIIAQKSILAASPVFAYTRAFRGTETLGALLSHRPIN